MAGVRRGLGVTLAFWNAFWIFIGIVAGAAIQYVLQWFASLSQRKNAKRLMKIEIEINRRALAALSSHIAETKEYALSNELAGRYIFFDMSGFSYLLSNPLISTGHFHDILGADGVSAYFKFAQDLNTSNAQNIKALFDQEVQNGKTMSFLNWLINTKMIEWSEQLGQVEKKLLA